MYTQVRDTSITFFNTHFSCIDGECNLKNKILQSQKCISNEKKGNITISTNTYSVSYSQFTCILLQLYILL